MPEDGQQPLQSAEDWWTLVLGSGYRWTVEQMSDGERARVRAANLKTLRDSGTISVETNVIYAVRRRCSVNAAMRCGAIRHRLIPRPLQFPADVGCWHFATLQAQAF